MNEEKKRFKYENNLKYRERVNKKIRRRTDKQYDKKLKKLQFEEKSLSEARLKVIKKLQEARWKPLYKKNIIVNRTEGKIRINGTDYLFENIGNTRLITNISNSTVTSGRVKTKFKPSIGGALAGGSMYGVAGAAAGVASGALSVIIWDYIPLAGGQTLGDKTGLYSLVVGFAVSLILIIIVSLCTKKPSEEMLKAFDDVKNGINCGCDEKA